MPLRDHEIFSIPTSRLLQAIEGETAFLSPPRRGSGARIPLAFDLEKALGAGEGCVVIGVDEAGRGPLAGPVVAAAVVLDPERPIRGLNDSKRLTPKARSALFPRILEEAAAVGIGQVTARGIDRWNIREASRRAMVRAVRDAGGEPDWVLVDGTRFEEFPFRQIAVVQGDRKVPSIAAASVVAKVVRDRLMACFHMIFPLYRFDRHKGYPTEEHAAAVARHGPTLIHRKTFHVPDPPPGLFAGRCES